jgi:imidazolonepropionase-like amidohydrolase
MNGTLVQRMIAGRAVQRALALSLCAFAFSVPIAAQHMPSQTPTPPPFFAIENTRIVTGTGSVIEGGVVVIGNGLIESVGQGVTVPGDAWVIDGSGLTVYPGLFDALTQVGLEQEENGGPGGGGGNPFARFAQEGSVSDGPEDRPATTPWLDAADMLDPDSEALEAWRKGGFTNGMVVPAAGIITGKGSVINYAGNAQEMVVRTPVALRLTMNPAGGFRAFPGSMMGVISYIKQLYLDAEYQSTYSHTYSENPRGQTRPMYDRSLAPVQASITEGWPTVLPANDVAEMRRVLKLARETGVRPVIAGGYDAYEIAEDLVGAGVPVLVNLDWPEVTPNADPEAEESLESLTRRSYAPTTPAQLEAAGATWAFYSGSTGSPDRLMGKVRRALEHGLSEEAALRALTISPAQIFGVDQMLGSVEEGKIANLVVTDGDLFDEETAIKIVFVDGHKFEVRSSGRPSTPPAVDMTGEWLLSLNNDSQEATADLEMTEDGTVSGTITGERGEQQIISSWVSDNEFSITVCASMGGGRQVEVIYSGTIKGDEITGTASFGEGFTMDFIGVRPTGGGR